MNKLQSLAARFLGIKMTTLRNPSDWFIEALGLRDSSSGEKVSHSAALGLSPYYCGLRMIAETVGSLPLNVYKRRPNRGQDIWRDHPAHALLHDAPNPEMTAMSFRQTLCGHAIGHGNGYAEIVRRGDGMPEQLWPLMPNRTRPIRADDLSLWYEVGIEDGSFRYLPAADVLHVPGLGFDGVSGYSLIRVAMDSIGMHLAQEKYGAKFFKNGGHVSAVAETDGVLKQETFDRLKKEIAVKIGGLDNSHRIALLEAGIKLKPLNITNEDAQLIESKRFSIEEWARWLNMPPHKLKEMSHSTFSNIEHQNIEWVVDTIRPWLVRFEQEYNRKLFRQPELFYAKHVVDGLLRGDQKSRNEAYAIGRSWGWLSANEIRDLEDRNPLDADIGDTYLTPSNMQRADLVGQAESGDREQMLTAKAASRVVGYELNQIKNNNIGYFASDKFIKQVADWMATSVDVASRYAGIAGQLNLIAAESDVPKNELIQAKSSLLTEMVLNGGNNA